MAVARAALAMGHLAARSAMKQPPDDWNRTGIYRDR